MGLTGCLGAPLYKQLQPELLEKCSEDYDVDKCSEHCQKMTIYRDGDIVGGLCATCRNECNEQCKKIVCRCQMKNVWHSYYNCKQHFLEESTCADRAQVKNTKCPNDFRGPIWSLERGCTSK